MYIILKHLVIWSVAVIAVFATAMGVVLAAARQTLERGRREKPKPADAAIILGAYTDGYRPSRPLVSRLKSGLHLYRCSYVTTIIVSGGRGSDETVSESSSMRRFLVLNGVPDEVILEDRHSSDTYENLRNSKHVMEQLNLTTAIVVTSDYHLPRALAVARQLQMDVTGYAARSQSREFRYAVREVFAMIRYRFEGRVPMV